MSENNHINYIEYYANDLEQVKTFYTTCFNWEFTDYGPNYTSFNSSGIQGGFEKTEEEIVNGALTVIYHDNLELCLEIVKNNGAIITKVIFSFPGGRRFEFKDPSGNKMAVWSYE